MAGSPHPNQNASTLPKAVYTTRDGLTVNEVSGGLALIEDPGAEVPRFVAYTTADGLTSNRINSITEDQWGWLYLATTRGVDR